MSVQNFFDSLSDEVKAKLKDCKTDEEMKKVFADAEIELDADVLESISGGIGIDYLSGITICRVKNSFVETVGRCVNDCSNYALQ